MGHLGVLVHYQVHGSDRFEGSLDLADDVVVANGTGVSHIVSSIRCAAIPKFKAGTGALIHLRERIDRVVQDVVIVVGWLPTLPLVRNGSTGVRCSTTHCVQDLGKEIRGIILFVKGKSQPPNIISAATERFFGEGFGAAEKGAWTCSERKIGFVQCSVKPRNLSG